MKDPKKVRAGRKGGKKSRGFARDPELARLAGKRSAWLRNKGKFEDYPLEGFIEMPFKVKGVEVELDDQEDNKGDEDNKSSEAPL